MRKVFVSQNQIIVNPGVHDLGEAKMFFFITYWGSMQNNMETRQVMRRGWKCVVYIWNVSSTPTVNSLAQKWTLYILSEYFALTVVLLYQQEMLAKRPFNVLCISMNCCRLYCCRSNQSQNKVLFHYVQIICIQCVIYMHIYVYTQAHIIQIWLQ